MSNYKKSGTLSHAEQLVGRIKGWPIISLQGHSLIAINSQNYPIKLNELEKKSLYNVLLSN